MDSEVIVKLCSLRRAVIVEAPREWRKGGRSVKGK